ncbi:MAG: oxidoreductase [Halobacteriovoraceae bacterium]|nr:oxidoreductase [Halobacteriovoraceae bacterium]|tara:strand:- start:611 stop:1315 length:705 start_codon:yes stop_codon:yes gene_type:complete
MKNFVFIGGSYGIGFSAISELISKNDKKNIKVHVYSRSWDDGKNRGEAIVYNPFDVLKDEFDTSGLPSAIDGFVYLPGTIKLKPFNSLKVEDFMEDINLNFMKMVLILKKLIPHLKKSEHVPCVLLFSSVVIERGMPFHSLVGASKGAIEGFVKNMAMEYAPKIRFNCIAPSLTNTPLASFITSNPKVLETSIQKHPLKRIAAPEDIGKLVSFLLNEDSYMTGQVFHPDGGMSG